MIPQLYPPQLDLMERARARFRNGVKRLLIQAATGFGKTHVSSEMIRLSIERGHKVLFIAHRRRLIGQKSERLHEFQIEHGIIMNGVRPRYASVQVASRDTLLSRSIRGDRMDLPPADLLIVDEAHNFGEEYHELLKRYPDAWVLGMTATPTTANGRGLGNFYQALECAVPTSQLVKEGYLVPVDCYAPLRMGEKRKQGEPVKGLAGDPVACWKKWARGMPTIVFAGGIKASLAVRDAFLAQGILAEHIDAGTPDKERIAVMERVQSGLTKVVANCSLWTEGVDVPELGCCQLVRPCKSAVLFFQAVGRVMRRHPSKTRAVLIDHAGAVLQHGFPDEDVPWSLDTEQTVDERLEQKKAAGETRDPVCCPECAFLFSGSSTCPQCGTTVRQPKKSKPAKTVDELLQEVPREQRAARLFEEHQRYWHTCLGVMAAKGRTVKCASGMFFAKFKTWPDRIPGLRNVPPFEQRDQPVTHLYPQYSRRAKA